MMNKIYLVEPSELRQLMREEQLKLLEMMKAERQPENEWIDSKDVPAYLKVSRKTWQSYRDKRLIPFSQVGRKIKVRKSDLDAFLGAFTVSASVELKTDDHGSN